MIAFGLPGGWEWIVLLLVLVLLFGNRIPGVARSLGSGITEFKRGLKDGTQGDSKRTDADKKEDKKEEKGSNDGAPR